MAGLEEALEFAVKKHRGQRDWGGKPYILHPLRVMIAMESEEEMTAAVLHDVIEDTQTTIEDLERAGFSKKVVKAVEVLSRREGERYEDYIERVKGNKIAVKVKRADLGDNMDARRQKKKQTKDDRERLVRYRKAMGKLRRISR